MSVRVTHAHTCAHHAHRSCTIRIVHVSSVVSPLQSAIISFCCTLTWSFVHVYCVIVLAWMYVCMHVCVCICRVGDVVTVIEGKHVRQSGAIKHIHRYYSSTKHNEIFSTKAVSHIGLILYLFRIIGLISWTTWSTWSAYVVDVY